MLEMMTDPRTENDALAGSIRRQNIEGDDEAVVAIFPTRKSGVDFLRENNAWGFVAISRNPDYIGMYLSGDAQEIRFFASVNEIVPGDEAPLTRPPEEYEFYDSGKKVVVFEPESLYELEDPIPLRERVPYSVRYTDLESFRTATTTDDLF